jgi:hypothetical protein
MSLTWGVINAVPRLSGFWIVSRVPSMDCAMPCTLSSTLDVSTREVEIDPADRDAPTSVPEMPTSEPEVLISDWEVSVREASMLRALVLIDSSEAVASATWPRIGFKAVSMSDRAELMV